MQPFDYLFICLDNPSQSVVDAVKSICCTDTRIILYHSKQSIGITRSLNYLVSNCPTQYAVRHDSDCIMAPWRLSRIRKQILEGKKLIFGGYLRTPPDYKFFWPQDNFKQWAFFTTINNMTPHPAIAFSTHTLLDNNINYGYSSVFDYFWDGKAQDYLLYASIISMGLIKDDEYGSTNSLDVIEIDNSIRTTKSSWHEQKKIGVAINEYFISDRIGYTLGLPVSMFAIKDQYIMMYTKTIDWLDCASFLKSLYLRYRLSRLIPYSSRFPQIKLIRCNYLLDLSHTDCNQLSGPLIRTKHMQSFLPHTHQNYNFIYGQSGYGYKLLLRYLFLLILSRLNPFANSVFMFNVNGLYYPSWYTKKDWFMRNFLISICCLFSNHTIYQSKFSQSTFLKLCPFHPKSSSIIPNPSFYTKDPPHSYNLTILSYLIELNPNRRREDLVIFQNLTLAFLQIAHSFKHFNFRVYVYTDPSNYSVLQNLEEISGHSRNLHFIYNEPYKHSSVKQIYKKIDYRLHLRDQDPCPNAVIEALSCNVVSIGSADSGIYDICGDSCLLYKSPNHNSFFYPRKAVDKTTLVHVLKSSIIHRDHYRHLVQQKSLQNVEEYIDKHLAIASRFL